MNSHKTFLCITTLVVAHLLGCDDMHTNTPAAGQFTTIAPKLTHPHCVLPVREIVELGDETMDDRVLLLTGQIAYELTPVNNHYGTFVDLELNVELELGEGLGWKISDVSIDRLNFKSQPEYSMHKTYLIDRTNETRKLNLLYNVNQVQLIIRRIWISL